MSTTGAAHTAEVEGTRRRGQGLRACARAVVSAVVLAALMEYVGWSDIARNLAGLHAWAVVLALVWILGESLARSLNWWQLSRVAGAAIAGRDVLHAYFMGGFAGVFLPSSLSTDAARSALAALRSGQRMEVLLATSASLNVIGLGLGSVLALLAGTLSVAQGERVGAAAALSMLLAAGCCVAIAALAVLSRWNRSRVVAQARPDASGLFASVSRVAGRFSRAFLALPSGRPLARVAAVAVVSYGFRIVAWYVLFLASGAEVSMLALLVLAPLVTIGAALPVSVAGFGGLQAINVYAFTQWGASPEQAIVVSLVQSTLYILLNAGGSLVYLAAPRAEVQATHALRGEGEGG